MFSTLFNVGIYMGNLICSTSTWLINTVTIEKSMSLFFWNKNVAVSVQNWTGRGWLLKMCVDFSKCVLISQKRGWFLKEGVDCSKKGLIAQKRGWLPNIDGCYGFALQICTADLLLCSWVVQIFTAIHCKIFREWNLETSITGCTDLYCLQGWTATILLPRISH